MNNENIFKTSLFEIDKSGHKKISDIFVRIINFDNIFFFAEEISSGYIFPIFDFTTDVFYEDEICFNTISYLKYGKFFAFFPVCGNVNIFEYKLNEDDRDFKNGEIRLADIDEVNAYIAEKNSISSWLKIMKMFELGNKYMCDIEKIKEKIFEVRNEEMVFNKKEKNMRYTSAPKIAIPKEILELGYDLSEQRELCNLVGRENEKKQIIKTVCIGGDSVILVGESGCGKTAIIESLALDIQKNECKWLAGKTILNFSTGNLIAGTKYRGDFEKKLMNFIEFCRKNTGRIIVFIDEIHTLYGLGAAEDSQINAMDILKPYISNGDITIIGATTKDEFEKYLANDPAFLRRFKIINVSNLDLNMNSQIILNYINYLEDRYRIKLNLNSEQRSFFVKYLIEITDTKNQRVLGEVKETNPTISKKILKDAFEESIYNNSKNVSVEDIYFAILSCSKLSTTFKKDKAQELKNKLISENNQSRELKERLFNIKKGQNKDNVLVLKNYK